MLYPKITGLASAIPYDTIWGLFPADALSQKIYSNVNTLTIKYGSRFDILYDEPQTASILGGYKQVFFWNQTIT